jgi:hypothetical protein
MIRRLLKRIPKSGALAVALAVAGTFPAYSGPFPGLTVGTPVGKSLYVFTLFVLGVWCVVAQMQENDARKRDESVRDLKIKEQRDEAMTRSEIRHVEDMEANARLERSLADARAELNKLSGTVASMVAAMKRPSPPTGPEITNLVESANTSMATIARHLDIRPSNVFIWGRSPSQHEIPFEMPKVPSSGKPPV